jgi:predicted negative regulator of RcsB-dependent stress response
VSVGFVVREQLRVRAVRAGRFGDERAETIVTILWAAYEDGYVAPEVLARCEAERERFSSPPHVLNRVLCLEVACGRYAEALAWKSPEGGAGDDEYERLVHLNLGEALACLGRRDEALQAVSWEASTDYLRVGAATHRAWLLAESGRIAEARTELRPTEFQLGLLEKFRAEWYFSLFAIELAEQRWDAAETALSNAEAVLDRESSRRNVSLYRGQLAVARGRAEESLVHFARAAQSVYRWQGGPGWLAWGDALAQLGRGAEARAAWQQCVERDAQSPAATTARARLG